MAIKVKLRQKKISGKRHSLYLDFYPAIPHPKTGDPTRREFLGYYLFDKPKGPLEKEHNKNTLQQAEQIRLKRDNELSKPEIYSGLEKEQMEKNEKGELNFVDYFRKIKDQLKGSNLGSWNAAFLYLESFTGGNLKFSDINETWCKEFREYLLSTKSNRSNKTNLANNSAVSYFNKLKASLRQAYIDGYLKTDINSNVDSIKFEESRRTFLTLEELNSLVKTECNNPLLKRCALFSALTGLRFSDIKKLIWNEVEFIQDDGYYLNFKQQKTKGLEKLPISDQAAGLMGEPKAPENRVFEGLTYSAYENKHLAKWIGLAGITKDITFHSFRHTFASLLHSKEIDILTISKLLGHRNVRTTEIYTHLLKNAKRNATNKIKLDETDLKTL